MTINIARDYTPTPGGRYRSDGPCSGEEFRESVLVPVYEKAKSAQEKITIIFDGGYGYARSFLEEAFGGLARKFGGDDTLSDMFILVSKETPSIETFVRQALCTAE